MLALIGIVGLLLSGCASKSLPPAEETMPPVVLATIGDAGIRDARHLYRAAVCGQLPADSASCEEVILRFPNEAVTAPPLVQRDIANRYRIGFAPGLFSDCFNKVFYPFTDVMENLKGSGFAVHDFRTAGRAISAGRYETRGFEPTISGHRPRKRFRMISGANGLASHP